MVEDKFEQSIELKKNEIRKLLMGIKVEPITREQRPADVQKEWLAVRTKLLRLLDNGLYSRLDSHFHVCAKEIRSPNFGPIMLKLAEKLPEFEAMHHGLVGRENSRHRFLSQKKKPFPKIKIAPRRVK